MKKSYTAAFKAQVVLDLLKDEKTIGQLASEYSVHPRVLREWKTIALRGLPSLFEKRDALADTITAHDHQVQELYAQIGRLTTQLAWIKKKSGLDPDKI
jgi:putative transposase